VRLLVHWIKQGTQALPRDRGGQPRQRVAQLAEACNRFSRSNEAALAYGSPLNEHLSLGWAGVYPPITPKQAILQGALKSVTLLKWLFSFPYKELRNKNKRFVGQQ